MYSFMFLVFRFNGHLAFAIFSNIFSTIISFFVKFIFEILFTFWFISFAMASPLFTKISQTCEHCSPAQDKIISLFKQVKVLRTKVGAALVFNKSSNEAYRINSLELPRNIGLNLVIINHVKIDRTYDSLLYP